MQNNNNDPTWTIEAPEGAQPRHGDLVRVPARVIRMSTNGRRALIGPGPGVNGKPQWVDVADLRHAGQAETV